jgi:hypothetical protein
MKYQYKFFEESCLECLNPSSECDDLLKYKCYIEWADKRIEELVKEITNKKIN